MNTNLDNIDIFVVKRTTYTSQHVDDFETKEFMKEKET